MKTFHEIVQHKGVQWGALVAILVGMTQFNTGLKLIYSKWTADEVAQAAQKKAEEAKDTADGVDERFDEYIQQQKYAIETQNKIAEAIGNYAAQQQAPNQMMRQSPEPRYWTAYDEEGQLYCYDSTESWWPDEYGQCE